MSAGCGNRQLFANMFTMSTLKYDNNVSVLGLQLVSAAPNDKNRGVNIDSADSAAVCLCFCCLPFKIFVRLQTGRCVVNHNLKRE